MYTKFIWWCYFHFWKDEEFSFLIVLEEYTFFLNKNPVGGRKAF